jgi:uncharacterized membrane protein
MPVSALLPSRLAAALFLVAFVGASHAQTVTVERIDGAMVYGISDDGQAAVGTDMNYDTFRWTAATGAVPLGRNSAVTVGVSAGVPRISRDGQVIAATILADAGTYATSGRWTVGGGWQQLSPMPASGGVMDFTDSSVFGMSGDGGTITGLFWRPAEGSAHGSAWTAATQMLDMGSSGNSSRIDGANADGSVLSGWDEHPTNYYRRATVWIKGVRTTLSESEYASEATALNGRGNVAVGYAVDARNRTAATIWRRIGQKWVHKSLGILPGGKPGAYSGALATSDDGSVVVGYNRPNPKYFDMIGFIWTRAGGMVSADSYFAALGVTLDGVTLTQVTDVSADGKVFAAIGTRTSPPYATNSYIFRLAD